MYISPTDLKGRIFIFLGPFGSGKTELAINFALWRKQFREKVAIADLDIISPYFRVRDHDDYLRSKGIEVITPPKELMHADLPIVSPKVMGYIANDSYELIMDIGGESDGAAVVGYIKDYLNNVNYTSFIVLNTRRLLYRDKESILKLIERLHLKSKINIDYIINNTNLGRKTTIDLIKEGEEILETVSQETDIPIAFSTLPDFLGDDDGELEQKLFKIRRFFPNDLEV